MLHRPIPTLLNHCVEGAGERAKILACSAFLANWPCLAHLGNFGQILAKLALFDNFWDFPILVKF